MKLQLLVSDSATAQEVVGALAALGHDASVGEHVPGLVVVERLDPSDAPSVQRLAARYDHPARRAVPA